MTLARHITIYSSKDRILNSVGANHEVEYKWFGISVGLSTSDLQSLLALYETTRQIKEDALAVDCSALM